MTGAAVPPDFGGLLSYWHDGACYLVRYGKGRPLEGIGLTPLNALQAHKTLGQMIEIGKQEGIITDEHLRQSEQLPVAPGLDNVMPRDQVDKIAGPD